MTTKIDREKREIGTYGSHHNQSYSQQPEQKKKKEKKKRKRKTPLSTSSTLIHIFQKKFLKKNTKTIP
jgi:hypothetical protein